MQIDAVRRALHEDQSETKSVTSESDWGVAMIREPSRSMRAEGLCFSLLGDVRKKYWE